MDFNYPRTARLIEDAVAAMDLDLSDCTVYTEAATGGFAATAATAIAAGADTVYALAADSAYGTAAEAHHHTERLADRIGDATRLVCRTETQESDVAAADIVTNTGFVRPIDDQLVDWLSSDTAVPLMYEPWEFRPADMAIDALWSKGIPVLGTDERDHRVGTQGYLQALAVKIALECELEVHRGSFLVLGDGRMAAHAAAGLESLGSTITQCRPSKAQASDDLLDSLPAAMRAQLDAVFVVDHATDELLVGADGLIDPAQLATRTRGVTIAHICGPIAPADIDAADLRCVPEHPAAPGTMSYTTGYLGPRPIVELHTAGLRVGTDLVRELRSGADWRTATETVAATPLALDFDDDFKHEHGFFD